MNQERGLREVSLPIISGEVEPRFVICSCTAGAFLL